MISPPKVAPKVAPKVSIETAEHVSKLARLELKENEIATFSQQLSAVLDSFEKIAAVDTTGVVPLVTPTEIVVRLRADEANESVDGIKCLENAPEKSGRLFKVPPVV